MKTSFKTIEEKTKILKDPKVYEFMGLTFCHGKMYYRYRHIETKKINHLIIPELSSKGVEKV